MPSCRAEGQLYYKLLDNIDTVRFVVGRVTEGGGLCYTGNKRTAITSPLDKF
jgi:hypothetical protein